MDEGIQLSRW